MSDFKLLGQKFSLPESWDQLTRQQLRRIAPYLFHALTDWDARVKVLLALAPVLSVKHLQRMGQSDSEYLVRQLEWIWTAPMETCPLPSFAHGQQLYYLPEPCFANLVGIEYVAADHYFKQFARDNPTPGALDLLLATICRPAKADLNEADPEWDGDRREKYNAKLAERRAVFFKTLAFDVKLVLLRYFIGSQRAFHQRYAELYKAGQRGGSGGRGGGAFGLLGTLDALAVEGVFGTFEQVCFTNLHTLFFHLLKRKRDEDDAPAEPA